MLSDKKIKVLMYGWEFPPNISGGLGIACHGIVHGLSEKKIDTTLVLPGQVYRVSEQVECAFEIKKISNFVNIKYVNSTLQPYLSRKQYSKLYYRQQESNTSFQFHDLYGANLLSEVWRYAEIAGELASEIPHDIIHAHDWMTILAAIKAKKISKKKLIFHVHALEYDRSGDCIDPVVFEIEKFGLENSDHIITVSQYTKNLILSQYHISPEKISVVHNGIFKSKDYHRLQNPSKRKNYVMFLGRITHQKGPFFFLETAKQLLMKRNDVEFIVAGDGDLLESMIEHAANLRIGRYVHFTGFLSRELVSKLYQQCKIYVMTSVSEPFGIAPLEALSSHVPIIISKQSGVSEVLNHVFKVDFWDTHEIANNISALLDSPVLGYEMIKESQQDVDRLSWNSAAKKIIDIYKNQVGI